MASRRFRIRPIANLPIRRGKVSTDNTGTCVSGDSAEKDDVTQIEQLEISNTPSVKENEISYDTGKCLRCRNRNTHGWGN